MEQSVTLTISSTSRLWNGPCRVCSPTIPHSLRFTYTWETTRKNPIANTQNAEFLADWPSRQREHTRFGLSISSQSLAGRVEASGPNDREQYSVAKIPWNALPTRSGSGCDSPLLGPESFWAVPAAAGQGEGSISRSTGLVAMRLGPYGGRRLRRVRHGCTVLLSQTPAPTGLSWWDRPGSEYRPRRPSLSRMSWQTLTFCSVKMLESIHLSIYPFTYIP